MARVIMITKPICIKKKDIFRGGNAEKFYKESAKKRELAKKSITKK
jgi:hypothetical protein